MKKFVIKKNQSGAGKLSPKKWASAIADLTSTFKTIITGCLIFIATAALPGCKKSNDKKPTCRIIAASVPSLGFIFNFSYDNSNGKLTRISAGRNFTTFDYPTDNTVIATTLDSGRFQSKRIINVNAVGLATNVRTENNAAGTAFTNVAFEYIGEELMKSTGTSSSNPNPIITTFTWVNGNLITITSGGTIIERRDYFTDKPRQIGDFFSFNEFIQGFETVRTKNLVKSTSGTNFTYEFGGPAGNISSVQVISPGGNREFIDYQYECK